MKLEQILLPTGFSATTLRAADIAHSLAHTTGAAVHVIHVGQPVEITLEVPEIGILRRKTPPDEVVLKRQLNEFTKKHLGDFGVPIVTVVAHGEPAAAIAQHAQEARIDRIIIATHAAGLLRRILHGSVSKYVLEHAPCPVVMVPPPVVESHRDYRGENGTPSAMPA